MSDLLERLRSARNRCDGVADGMVLNGELNHPATGALTEAQNALNDSIAGIEELEQRWIPVSERLPEEPDRYYLVANEFWDSPQLAHFTMVHGVAWWDGRNSEKHYLASKPGHRVTHWMPLPAPPEHKEGE